MKIIILGSTGILARTLILYLRNKNFDVVTISREKKNNKNFNLKNFLKINALIFFPKKLIFKLIDNV